MSRLRFLPVIGVLLGCLVTAWSYRFTPIDHAVRVGVDSLVLLGEKSENLSRTNLGMVMTTQAGSPGSVSFGLPGIPEGSHLLIRFHAVAMEIVEGRELWDDGRIFLEWLSDGNVIGVSRIHSARGNEDAGFQQIVISPPARTATPVLRFQNLGAAGTYEIHDLEIVAVRERKVWSWGKWFLAAGFLTTLAALAGGTKKPARWRGWMAAGVWMIVAVGYAFPGPWDVARPFIVPFVFVELSALERADDVDWQEFAAVDGKDQPLMGRFPQPDDIGLRLKQGLPWLRPLLHVALLFAPVFAMAWFVGAKRAFWLGWALSLSIEAAQTLYGFGFGWDDVWDLFVNGIAISAAVWSHRKFATRLHARLPFPFPEPAAEVARAGSARMRPQRGRATMKIEPVRVILRMANLRE